MKNHPIFFMLLLCFLSIAITGNAQNYGNRSSKAIIKGKITQEDNGQALDYATITIFSTQDSSLITGGISDENGLFSIETKAGNYFAKIEFLSFEEKIIENITLAKGKMIADLGNIILVADAKTLTEVEVRAEKSQMQMSLDKRTFNVGKDLANTGASAQDILDNVPSVSVDVEGRVSLRGNENVRILIDGKPSGLVSIDNANGLRSLPSNMIDKVEVITNPSARYEAEGMTGIINIVLKKEKKKGINGAFDVTVGEPANYGVGVNMNFRREKLNFFVNYGLSYRKYNGSGFNFQERTTSNGLLIQDQTRSHNRGGLSNSIRFGSDFFLNKHETITASFLYKKGDEDNLSTVFYRDYLQNRNPQNLQEITERTNDEIEKEDNLQYSINYKKTFDKKGKELVATLQFEEEKEVEGSDYLEKYFDNDYNPLSKANLLQDSENAEGEKQWLFQVDFTNPIGKEGKFELGARSSLRDINNDYDITQLNDNEWQPVLDAIGNPLSNNFQYEENIHAVYAILGDQKGKFSYQLGLRGEYSHVITELLETNEVNDRDYFNLFPSAHFTYKLPAENAVQISYSRRIQRPRFWYLNPFFSFSDSRNQRTGNPNLDPELTHSFELGHIKYFDKGTISSSIYYRYSTGTIMRIQTIINDQNTVSRPENLKNEKSYGLEVTASYNPYKWWRLNGDVNFFKSTIDGSNFQEGLTVDAYSMQGRATSRMTLWKKTDVQLRLSYYAPRKTLQSTRKAIFSTDLGISRDILKNKGTLTLSVRDLFNTRKYRSETFIDDFYSNSEFQWRTRSASLTFSYRLNQKKKRGGKRGGYQGGGEGGEF
jgi:outer membrane receptor protein involved in Fe transport